MPAARLPIVNYIYGTSVGDFVARVDIGANKNPAYVVLDTGSSTLAVWEDKFGDAQTHSTPLVQFVGYGTGHWAGPVQQTSVGLGETVVDTAYIAQIQSGIFRGHKQFYPADGIMGLAYFTLDDALDVGSDDFDLVKYDSAPEWQALMQSGAYKRVALPPYFTQVEMAGLAANKFAFSTRRSQVKQGDDPANDPENQGIFVLGGGEEEKDLYSGGFMDVKEIDGPHGLGRFYNSNLKSVRVGNGKETPIAEKNTARQLSNSIIDSGTNSLAVTQEVASALKHGGIDIDALNTSPPSNQDVAKFPSIFFTFEGVDGDVTLECKAETYLQMHCLDADGGVIPALAVFPGAQSILGLPLMNNYYVVFDRSDAKAGKPGRIRFAAPAT